MVLAKDSDRYPLLLRQVKVSILRENSVVETHVLLKEPLVLKSKWWWKVWNIRRPQSCGWVECNVAMHIEREGTSTVYYNDNYRTSSHKPLKVYVADEELPRFQGLYFGDPHTHSTYTEDQVEFGSPLEGSVPLAKAMGLSFFGATDHSYDLDDREDDYLVNDPSLPKWKHFKEEVGKLNSRFKNFVILPGEEISCRNSRNQNVHLILLGNPHFFPGSGDSAERWFRTNGEHNVGEILRHKEHTAVAVAAHPFDNVPFLQRLLLGRGTWQQRDLEGMGLNAIQFANGNRSDGFEAGYKEWIRLLLCGKKLFALAGNDSHGNFSRFRQIGIPFVKISERDSQLFGKMRTGVFVSRISMKSMLESLRVGACVLTDGPVANLRKSGDRSHTSLGKTFKGTRFTFGLSSLSTKEFGRLESVRVLLGEIGSNAEVEIFKKVVNDAHYESSFSVGVKGPSYIRVEIASSSDNASDGRSHFCYTNPVWLTP